MQLSLKLSWRKAFLFATECDGWMGKCFMGGLWILLFPPLGWLMALGYRKEIAFRLIENRLPFLPDWSNWPRYLLDGIKAAGVIMVYFTPFLLAFWSFGTGSLSAVAAHIGMISVSSLLIPLCVPVFLPGVPLFFALFAPWIHFELWQLAVLALLFGSALFLMPSAFGQVSLRGTFLAAFRVDRAAAAIAQNVQAYLEAWCIALIITALSFALPIIYPWGIFWSYLAGSFAFNNALALSTEKECRERFRDAAAFAQAD
jgi:hypothetical protein